MTKLRKGAKYALLGLLMFVVVGMASGLALRAYKQHQANSALTIRTAHGVDEAMFVKIGGIEQWVTIRGQDRANPVILILHGGPGFAVSPLALYTRAWERDFTLVQWDQRGAGKTFGRSGPVGSATIERMALDGLEVAEFVVAHLKKRKIILLGWSWGTVLGIHMAKTRPDLFYAYVGTGQIVNERDDEALGYAALLAESRSRQDWPAIRKLETIGPPPWHSQSKLGVLTRQAFAYEQGAPSVLEIVGAVLIAPRYTLFDSWDWVAGLYTSQEQFLADDMTGPFLTVDLPQLGTKFAIPIFIFQGKEDYLTPAQVARAYLDTISAPQKHFVSIDSGGHLAMVVNSDEFLKLLVEQVRPLAIRAES